MEPQAPRARRTGDAPRPGRGPGHREEGQQATIDPEPEEQWSDWDIGRALTLLRSTTPGVVRRTLRKLHIRVWHAPASRLQTLLRHAGAPSAVIDMVPEIVDTCRVCRAWASVAPRSISSGSLAVEFNVEIQFDFMFWKEKPVCHLIDVAVRFCAAQLVPDRSTTTLIKTITLLWFKLHGAPKQLTADTESALNSDEARVWADRCGFKLNLRPRGAHAKIVERHNALLRDQLHYIDDQMDLDGIVIDEDCILAEAVLAKNALVSIGGASPYQAVYGRQPNLLLPFEPASASQFNEADGILPGASRHVNRLRHAAVSSIVNKTAVDKLSRALDSNTRSAAERLELSLGDQVDFHRPTDNRDESGWRGPATVNDLTSITDGSVGIKWHNRSMTARIQDIRRSLILYTWLQSPYRQGDRGHGDAAMRLLQNVVEKLSEMEAMDVGYVYDSMRDAWHLNKHALDHPAVFQAVLQAAACFLQVIGCLGARLARHVKQLKKIDRCTSTVLWMWPDNKPLDFAWMIWPPLQVFFADKELGADAENTNIIQFKLFPSEVLDGAKRLHPNLPHLGGLDMSYDPMEGVDFPPDGTVQPPPQQIPQPPVAKSSLKTASMIQPLTPRKDPVKRDRTPDSSGSGNPAPHVSPCLSAPNTPEASASDVPVPSSTVPDTPTATDLEDEDMDELFALAQLETKERSDEEEQYWKALFAMTSPPDVRFESPCHLDYFEYVTYYQQPVNRGIVQLLLVEDMAQCFWMYGPDFKAAGATDELIYEYREDTDQTHAVIKRELPVLTPEEVRHHQAEVDAATYNEYSEWARLGCFRLRLRKGAENIVDGLLVVKWKKENDKMFIRVRLALRGFKDRFKTVMSTYAGTASRWSHRALNAVAVQYRLRLFSADINKAFCRGITYDELAKRTGEPRVTMQMDVPRNTTHILRRVPGFEQYDPVLHTLEMLKPGIGSVYAPRAWNIGLGDTLKEAGMSATVAEPQFYVRHQKGRLVQALNVHVDDLKGADEEPYHTQLIALLEKKYGKTKRKYGQFEHVGILHDQDEKTFEVTTTQDHYLKQLSCVEDTRIEIMPEKNDLPEDLTEKFVSLVGAMAWTSMSRPEAVVFISYLQRHLKHPTYQHLKDANRTLKWMKKKPCVIKYSRTDGTFVIKGISDSAFKAEVPQCLALRGAMIGLGSAKDDVLNLLDFWCRRHTRVTRSTFAAELHNLVSTADKCMMLAGFLQEVLYGTLSATELAKRAEQGLFDIPIYLFVDAYSVFSAIAATEVKIPTESQLIYEVRAMHDHLQSRRCDKLFWIDTEDMLSDGLTKGAVCRDAILRAVSEGRWHLTKPYQQWPKYRPSTLDKL